MDYFIAGLNEQALAQDICKKLKGKMLKRKISYFTGGELNICINNENLKGKRVYIVQSIIKNANDRAMELFLLANAVKNLGGEDIIAIIPYLGYSRQDRINNQGEAFSLQCLAKLIKAADIKKVITVDLHNPISSRLFELPVVNLLTASIFEKIVKHKNNAIIIAPDIGATSRAQDLANLLEIQFIVAKKERTKSGNIKIIDIPKLSAIADKDCYLVDDILDTGKTICAVAKELERFKPKSVYALISHGIFEKGALQAIDESCINKIYVTDSVDCSAIKYSNFYIVKLGSMIANFLQNNEE